MKITKETLLDSGYNEITELDGTELKWYEYEKTYNLEGYEFPFYVTVRPFSNTLGRDWSVHIDNARFESVASLDVSEFEQIWELLKLCIPKD